MSIQHGLNGVCDFIMTRSGAVFISAPAIIVVERKRNITGLGQCIAAMLARACLMPGEGIATVYEQSRRGCLKFYNRGGLH